MRNKYEPNTAVTFLLLGLGIGTVLALICNPSERQQVELERIKSRSIPRAQPQTEGENRNKRIA
jgi:hypothetical protein